MTDVIVNPAALQTVANKMFRFSENILTISAEAVRLMNAVKPPAIDDASTKTTAGFAKHMQQRSEDLRAYAFLLASNATLLWNAGVAYQTAEADNTAHLS